MSTVDTSTWNPDPDLNESLEGIPLNSEARIDQTWQALRILMAAGGLHGLQLVTFEGATASADGKQGLVPAPEAGDQDKFLKGDGTWGVLSASDIPNIDASKIASGTIDLARLPAGALERLVTVADQTARFALTTASVQLGDTVKQLDTGVMYIVVDTSKLNQAAGYVEYTAGSAASVPWSGVTGKPSSFTPSSHTHGNISNGGAIGSTSGLPVVTGTNGVLQAGSFGSAAGTVCEGNDSRLSDARTPTSHTHGSITNDGKLGTASRVVVTDGSKVIGVSSITTTKLGYLTDVTANIQGQIDGKADDSSVVHKTGDETVAGVKTFSGRIELTRTQDASGTADNKPALMIGSMSGTHLELDGNELMAKASGTTTGSLFLNTDGGNVYIGGTSADHLAVTGKGKGSSTVPVYTNTDGIVTACGSSLAVGITGNAATATEFSANKSVTLTGDVTGTASSKAGWSIATTVGAISNAQIAAMFENDGVDPDDPPMTYPERAVLCGDGVWRYFEQIPFPEAR